MGNWLNEELQGARARATEVGRHTVLIVLSMFVLPCVVFALFRPIGASYVNKVIDPYLRWWYMAYVAAVIVIYIHRVAVGILPVSQHEPLNKLPRTLVKLAVILMATFLIAVGVHLLVGLQTRSLFWAGLMAVGVSATFFFTTLALLFPNPNSERHLRGRRLLTLPEARSQGPDDPDGIPWGGLRVPLRDATTHFAVIGQMGSGKTVTIHAIMKSVLSELGGPRCQRALIYDTKGDTLPALAGMGLLGTGRVHILNPFDQRSSAWDMAADIRDTAAALELATILSPLDERSTSPYFSIAARDILQGILATFIARAPGRWTLRDVVNTMTNEKNLKRVLRQSPEGQELLSAHARVMETWNNVRGSISTKIEPYRVIAALWSHCAHAVSLESWFSSSSILVLGSRERSSAALQSINCVLFKRLTEIAIDEQEDTNARTWFFIDEAKYAGKLDGIASLVDRGRSKGMCVMLGFQDVEGMRAVYSDREADSLIGGCVHKAILRVASPGTAEWATSVLSEYEVMDQRVSRTAEGFLGGKRTYSEQRDKRQAFLPSQFMGLEAPDQEYGPEGVYLRRKGDAFRSRLKWREIDLPPVDPSTPGFLPRPQSDQILAPWDAADLVRLGLVGDDEAEEPSPRTKARPEPTEPDPSEPANSGGPEPTVAVPPVESRAEPAAAPDSPVAPLPDSETSEGAGAILAASPIKDPARPSPKRVPEEEPPLGPGPKQKGLLDGVGRKHKP